MSENTQLTIDTTNVEEVKLEEKIEEKPNLLNLSALITQLLINETQLNELKINLKLESSFLDLLKKINELLPELLGDIDTSISEIVKDKVIDSKDVPRLIVLIKDVYKNFTDSKKLKVIDNITLEDSINFIKNLLLMLIELEHIKVNDKENVLLIIDLCVDLLTTSIDIKEGLIDKIKGCLKKCC